MTCSCWSRAWKGFLSQPAVLEDRDLICLEGPDPKGTGMALPRFQFKDFPELGMNSLPCHWQWRWLLDIAVVEKCALLKWLKYFNYLKIFPFSLCSSAFLLHLWNIAFTFQFVHYYPKSSLWCSTTGTLCSEMLVFLAHSALAGGPSLRQDWKWPASNPSAPSLPCSIQEQTIVP